ncbi:MAG: hypothetical protein Q7V31_03630 [Parvibaculum sp.]|uniref:hypothetical protein n=1 Tax=Parvibaculum sp. TaxID=2024848 RepID=UPI00272002B5|nr:hypothetical protein [Parvibaculum sp.]MDO8837993.1 hypothetical protein [Parvibaculum sp.]
MTKFRQFYIIEAPSGLRLLHTLRTTESEAILSAATDNRMWANLTSFGFRVVEVTVTIDDGADDAPSEWKLIEKLREEEGATITICCDNPEGPPYAKVICCAGWTDWKDVECTGDTVLVALRAALVVMEAWNATAD